MIQFFLLRKFLLIIEFVIKFHKYSSSSRLVESPFHEVFHDVENMWKAATSCGRDHVLRGIFPHGGKVKNLSTGISAFAEAFMTACVMYRSATVM